MEREITLECLAVIVKHGLVLIVVMFLETTVVDGEQV
jgi:hypothetical protein